MKKKTYRIKFKEFRTFATLYGDVCSKDQAILILHGGPGSSSDRYEPLLELSNDIPVITYDQFGGGQSKIPNLDKSILNMDLFMDELENVKKFFGFKHYHILGHSWGGMLLISFLVHREHFDVSSAILFSTLPSTKSWNYAHRIMISKLDPKYHEVLLYAEVDNPIYPIAEKAFYKTFVGDASKRKYVYKRKKFHKTNREIYEYMWGNNEIFGNGTLSDWNEEDNLKKIDVPTLIISGENDESTPEINEFMEKEIKGAKRVLLKGCSHCGYADDPDTTLKVLREWLKIN